MATRKQREAREYAEALLEACFAEARELTPEQLAESRKEFMEAWKAAGHAGVTLLADADA